MFWTESEWIIWFRKSFEKSVLYQQWWIYVQFYLDFGKSFLCGSLLFYWFHFQCLKEELDGAGMRAEKREKHCAVVFVVQTIETSTLAIRGQGPRSFIVRFSYQRWFVELCSVELFRWSRMTLLYKVSLFVVLFQWNCYSLLGGGWVYMEVRCCYF